MKLLSFICLLVLLLTGCEDYSEDFPNAEEVVSTPTFTPAIREADGESQTQVEIKFSTKVAAEKATVELKTTVGLFKEAAKDAITLPSSLEKATDGTLQRVVRTQLIHPSTEGEATITTRIAGYIRTDKISFTKAHPDSLVVESDKIGLKKGIDNTATITVSLLRRPGRGKPALSLPIVLTLQDKDGNNHGQVKPSYVLSGADGKCKFLISRSTDTYSGSLYVKATYPDTKLQSKLFEILPVD